MINILNKTFNKTQPKSIKKKKTKKVNKDFSLYFTDWIWSNSSLIVHTIFFVWCFVLILFGVNFEKILLVLTTIVSLEAIYLAIFIQITVNRNTASLREVEKDIDEIQEDIDEIQEDVEDIQEEDEQDEIIEDKTIKYIEKIEVQMQLLTKEISELKKYKK